MERKPLPILYIVIPCYNEETVLPITAPLFLDKLTGLMEKGAVGPDSRILFVDDGSRDRTWDLIRCLTKSNPHYRGLRLSRNRGQQNAMLAGMAESVDICDITVTVDCDGQDDLNAIDDMVSAYMEGSEIVYGVRSSRTCDSFFKRTTAMAFYKLMTWLGVETVENHSEYRLMSTRAVRELLQFKEVNLFLRGMVTLVGFPTSCVYFERHERTAGNTHYSPAKLIALAFEGITSFSIKPIRLITIMGLILIVFSLLGIAWGFWSYFSGATVAGWPSLFCAICFVGGVQLLSLGVIGEYVGKIYLETKGRPRYIISERTDPESSQPSSGV